MTWKQKGLIMKAIFCFLLIAFAEQTRGIGTQEPETNHLIFFMSVSLLEEGKVLREQTEDCKSQKWVSADSGGHQRLGVQILYPRPARYHRCE